MQSDEPDPNRDWRPNPAGSDGAGAVRGIFTAGRASFGRTTQPPFCGNKGRGPFESMERCRDEPSIDESALVGVVSRLLESVPGSLGAGSATASGVARTIPMTRTRGHPGSTHRKTRSANPRRVPQCTAMRRAG